jgi:hypothetical protein
MRSLCNLNGVGMNKMVINHLGKLFVTNDAATIMKELEVAHPAAKLIVMASQQQEHEAGGRNSDWHRPTSQTSSVLTVT